MKKFFLFTLLFSLFLPAFSQDKLPPGLEYITSGLTIRMISPVTAKGERTLKLEWKTNQIYNCSNYELVQTIELAGQRLTFFFKGIRKPEKCVEVQAPGYCESDLSALKPGKYKVAVWINMQLFKAKLNITDSYAEWTMDEDPDLLRMLNPKLWVVPDGMIWGKITYKDRNMKSAAEAFVEDVKALGATSQYLTGGDYGEFYVHLFGFEELPLESGEFDFPFYFFFDGEDYSTIEALLARYNTKYGTLLRISMGSSSGKRLQSWGEE